MKQLGQNEVLSLSKALAMEATGVAISKAGLAAVSDDELRALIQTGIVAAEARIRGIQQFVDDNNQAIEGQVQ